MVASGSRLRIRRRISPAAAFYRAARPLVTVALLAALIISGYRFFTRPYLVGALEFTPHAVSVISEAKGVLGVASGDMDGDGDIDIITAGNDGIKVYENTGDKTFATGKLVDPTRGERLQIVDIDQDGASDILATLDNTPGVRWYRNAGGLEFDGSFIGTGKNAHAYAADIDQDQVPDVVVASVESGVYVVRRWMNDGSGGLTSSVLPTTGDQTVTAVGVGDLNGNDWPDIAISGSGGLQVFDTNDGATWIRSDIDDSEINATHLVVGEVTGDGHNDVVVVRNSTDKIYLYRFIENFQFEKITLNPNADATTVAIRDLDEDGDEDVIVVAQDDDSIFWYDNNGSNEFTQRTIASDVSSVFDVAIADFDNDGDFDFATGDHTRGTVWWYERTRAKPVATAPDNIQQTVDGAGRITFDTTISDGDFDATRIRVQYSLDGTTWHKPWLIKATPEVGSVDLKNSNGYQIGTSNAIDTNTNDSAKLTLIWDTKSTGNTGGPIVGDVGNVQLRIIPRDDISVGNAAISSTFRVDNRPPQGLGSLRVVATSGDQVQFSWDQPTDSSAFSYKLYYGTNHTKVLEQKSDVWDADDDPDMEDVEATGTTVTGLTPNTTYTFKLFVTDAFGNLIAPPSVKATTINSGSSPLATPTPDPNATPTPTPDENVSPTPTETQGPITPTPTLAPTPTPTPTTPSTTFENEPPVADAGIDQVVNPSALVILDGTASIDGDGDPLSFVWRQLSGPTIELLSERTATPSFSAGAEHETYIFAVTVRDQLGASATDTVTVAVKALPSAQTQPVDVGKEAPTEEAVSTDPTIARLLLKPLDIALFAFAILLTVLSLAERALHSLRERRSASGSAGTVTETPKGKVVHYRTNEPIAGALVLIYGADGKLRSRERTSDKGEFSTLFPAGEYTLRVQAEDFTFAPAASPSIRPESGIVYSGGKLTVPVGGRPLTIVIPMKPIGAEVSTSRTRVLHVWQWIQRVSRLLSWPVFIVGALLNTVLIFWLPGGLFLAMEILYVFLVIIKVALEVRIRPAYGMVRDSITHVPIGLAVVRLFESGTNRLVMTRVTDSQGKFFALPPSGSYTVTITKPGYAVFSKNNVQIESQQDSVLQMTADLMPVAPSGGLAQARAAVV